MSEKPSTGTNRPLSVFIDSLRLEAVSVHGVPQDLAAEASRVALRRFEGEPSREIGARERARISSYFRGVLRRRVVASRGPELKELRSRFMLRALAEDLKVTGRSGKDIYLEIAHDHASHVGPAALRALEEMLCG